MYYLWETCKMYKLPDNFSDTNYFLKSFGVLDKYKL